MTRRVRPSARLTRSAILFAVGVGGIIYELVTNHAERPTLLLILAGMAGLPVFVWRDELNPPDPPRRPGVDRGTDANV